MAVGLYPWARTSCVDRIRYEVICWLFVLREAPLSRAYGLASLTCLLVLFAGLHVLGEEVRRLHIAGTVLIVIGIAVLLYRE